MSAAAPPPPRRGSPTPKAACSRTPPPPAWCSISRPKPKAEREPATRVDSSSDALSSGGSPMSVVSGDIKPLTFSFGDDGLVPNNPLPFLVYKGAIDVDNDHP